MIITVLNVLYWVIAISFMVAMLIFAIKMNHREFRKKQDVKPEKSVIVTEVESITPAESETELPPRKDKRNYHRWTDGEVNQLKGLIKKGNSDEQIATIMNKSVVQVRSKRTNLGLQSNYYVSDKSGKPWTTKDLKLLRELYLNGFTTEQMAAYMDRSVGAITSKLYVTGIKDKVERT